MNERFIQLLLVVADCEFLEQYYRIEERDTISPTDGIVRYLDRHPSAEPQAATTIRIRKIIDDVEYQFISPPVFRTPDALKTHIEFNKGSYLFYKRKNPSEYYFEL